ncbi:ion channel [Halobaculum sp. D14]|uniref:ion channel n=1 Tax=Halobaculum sp. D14 TaxID=3421642 RepID=UPI003EBB22B4
MVLYPTNWFGGLEETDSGVSIIHSYDENVFENLLSPSYYPQLIESLFEIWQNSFYFSAVTFTTIGSNSYQVNSSIAKLFLAFESFSGTFLLALFVYSLGKQVAR